MGLKCVFCGSRDMSKQHIWGDWLKGVLPELAQQDRSYHSGSFKSVDGLTEFTTRMMPLSLLESKVRVVCRDCNSGWMNEVESTARPTLTALIRGESIYLTLDEQWALSVWTSLAIIMNEYVYPKVAAVSAEHRDYLFTNRQPLPGLQVWMAPLEATSTEWKNKVRHMTFGITNDPEVASRAQAKAVVVRPNSYSTTIGLGQLVIYAEGGGDPSIDGSFWPIDPGRDPLGLAKGLVRTCFSFEHIQWPTAPPLSDETTWLLSEAFARSVEESG